MKKVVFTLALVMIALTTFGQKMKVKEGNIKNLKDIAHYDVVFEYTDLKIPKYDSEEDFLADKMAKREEKEKGSGERFKEDWFDDRAEHYHPKFIESFNKRFDDEEVKVSENTGADYVMVVHTTLLYPGYNVGVWRQNAEIEATIAVHSASNPEEILFQCEYTKVPGNGAFGNDYDSGYRISECYAKVAKEFAKHLIKKAK